MTDAVERVEQLLKLPQHLCNMCGRCCKLATFKGGLSYEEVIKLANDPEAKPSQSEGARDFLSIFKPYESVEEAKKISPELVKTVLDYFGPNRSPSFFYCQYTSNDGKCLIHEDRPLLCRMYPIPQERTFFFPGCGFEEASKKNWQEILQILSDLERRKALAEETK